MMDRFELDKAVAIESVTVRINCCRLVVCILIVNLGLVKTKEGLDEKQRNGLVEPTGLGVQLQQQKE